VNNKSLIIGFFWLCCSITEGQAGLLDKITDTLNPPNVEDKKAELERRLTEIEKNYGETAVALKSLQIQIEQARQSLGKTQQERAAQQKQIDKRSKELAAQIKAAYAMGEQEKLKIILNQKDPVLSSRMMLYYNYINQARLKQLNELNAALKQQEQLDQQQQNDSKQLQERLEQKQSTQTLLDNTNRQRDSLLSQLKRDFSSRQQQLKDLKESEIKLKGLLGALQDENAPKAVASPAPNGDFEALKGRLNWPANGAVHRFGIARHAKGVWDGVLINADEGTEVRAVANGKVAYADPLQGYGSLVIIDHGQGYMTVHGFNQSLYKRVGDNVNVGDVIATVGKSGGRKQSGLYFGIRKQGMPIDPLAWFIKPSK
jgi:septal ring factor EnvC (AmiA/AmiB activator)